MTPDGELDYAKAEGLKLTMKALYETLLAPGVKVTYRENFPLLYDNREVIWMNPRKVRCRFQP